MPKPNQELTHKEIIQETARRIGNFHKPSVYIKQIKEEHGIDVSNSSITKSLGNLISRLRTDENHLVELAKRLLHACHSDKSLAHYVVEKARFV